MSALPTQEEAKRAYDTLHSAFDHLGRNVLLPAIKRRAEAEQTNDFDELIVKLETRFPADPRERRA